jgi:basic membrane protein A
MSFGASAALVRVADEFPEQRFAGFDARAERPNVTNYAGAPESVSFAAGAAAAWLSATGKVGTLFGTEGPGYWRWVASYIAGALLVRPEVEVLHDFLADFSPTPAQGEQAAERQYVAGVDVIMAHLDAGDAGVFVAARRHGRYAFGFNGERRSEPAYVVLDVVRHLEVCVFDAVQRALAGTLEPGLLAWGMREGHYALELGTPPHPLVTAEFRHQLDSLTLELNEGAYAPLPARRQDVEPFLAEQLPRGR